MSENKYKAVLYFNTEDEAHSYVTSWESEYLPKEKFDNFFKRLTAVLNEDVDFINLNNVCILRKEDILSVERRRKN